MCLSYSNVTSIYLCFNFFNKLSVAFVSNISNLMETHRFLRAAKYFSVFEATKGHAANENLLASDHSHDDGGAI